MTSTTLVQIADSLDRIESHLAVIARLLATRQDVTLTVQPNGQYIRGQIRAVDTQVASR